MNASPAPTDHIVPDGFDPVPPPLTARPSPRPTPAEAARTLLAAVMLALAPNAPTVNGATRDYGPIAAAITDAGASMLSGFYLPGDPWGSFAVAVTATP